MDYMQILLEKIKDQDKINEELNLEMTVGMCDISGDDVKDEPFEEMRISDLRICNLPVEYFFGKEPTPYSNSLELCFLKS